ALSTWYVSRLGADAIAAVSLVFPLSLLATTAMAGGVRARGGAGGGGGGAALLVFRRSLPATTAMAGGSGAGASSAVARALGAGRRAAANVLAGNALVLRPAAGLAFAPRIPVRHTTGV